MSCYSILQNVILGYVLLWFILLGHLIFTSIKSLQLAIDVSDIICNAVVNIFLNIKPSNISLYNRNILKVKSFIEGLH